MSLAVRCRWLVVVSAVACGCGGSGGGSTPSTPTPLPTPLPTPPIAGFTFNYESGVSSADRTLIEGGIRTAQALFEGRFGRAISVPTIVNVVAGDGPGTAQAQGHLITIYSGNSGWIRASSTGHLKTVVHEAFHVLQNEAGWAVINDPTQRLQTEWLSEGSAEYVGYAGVIEAGATSYAAVRACEVQIYFNGGGASTPPLQTIIFRPSEGASVNSRYAIAWIAVDRLTNGLDGIARLKGMWEAVGAWDQRFQAAFSRTPAGFYSEFADYRQGLVPGGGAANCASH